MDKHTMDDLWLQVRKNHQKLDSCQRHDFSIDMNPEKPVGKKYQCTRCGGEVDLSAKHWYEKGLAHAENNGKKC